MKSLWKKSKRRITREEIEETLRNINIGKDYFGDNTEEDMLKYIDKTFEENDS